LENVVPPPLDEDPFRFDFMDELLAELPPPPAAVSIAVAASPSPPSPLPPRSPFSLLLLLLSG
jgi:hypothetical protein